MMIGIPCERAQGEKGANRWRKDRRVRQYLLSMRPEPGTERIVSYRTEACVGYNMALDDGAGSDVLEFLASEYAWAVAELREMYPDIEWDRGRWCACH